MAGAGRGGNTAVPRPGTHEAPRARLIPVGREVDGTPGARAVGQT